MGYRDRRGRGEDRDYILAQNVTVVHNPVQEVSNQVMAEILGYLG